MRKFVSLAVGMLFGLLGWWGVSAFLASPTAVSRGPERASPPPERAAPPLAPAQKSDAAGHAAPPSRDADGAKGPLAVAPTGGPTLHGTIVGIDEAGAVHPELDGAFTLHWLEAKERRSLDVTVRAGRFTASAPRVASIAVDDVVLGDCIARLADPEVEIPASGEVALRVRLIPASSLRVVDAETRTELDGVDVYCDLERMRGVNRLAPHLDDEVATVAVSSATPVVTGAHSPVVLPPIEGTPNYWVHAAGHAWTLIEVQQLIGGARDVPLARGGSLTIRFLQKPQRDDLELVVRNTTTNQSFQAAVVGATRPLVDVAAGHFEIEASIPAATVDTPGREQRTVVARAECDVGAGATSDVDLALGDVPSTASVARVPFRGVVTSGDARLAMELTARLSSLDPERRVRGPNRFLVRPLVRDPDRAGQWSFDFGTVLPGRTLVTIQPLQVHTVFEVGPTGLTDAQIELPTLGEVEVAVTDAQSGAPIANAGVSWRAANHPMADDDLPQSAETHGDPPVARFLAPLGWITVSCWPDTYTTGERKLEVLTSLQRVTIAVGREQYIRLIYKQGTAVVPIDPAAMAFAVVDGDGKEHQIGWAREAQTGALKLIIDQPGDYTVRFPDLAGFRTPDERVVHVESGGTAELEVELQ